MAQIPRRGPGGHLTTNEQLFKYYLIAKGGPTAKIKHITTYWDRFEDFLANRLQGIRTGFPTLDAKVLGLPGLTVVQGEPKSNKSTFCLQVALHHAKNYGPVIYYDAENGVSRLLWRLGCLINTCSTEEYAKPENAALREQTKTFLEKYPFTIIDEAEGDIDNEYLEQIVHAVYEKHPKKRILLVLDSIQALPRIREKDIQNTDTWVLTIDRIKKFYQGYLTILCTSEKNKASYKEAVVGGSKGSGSIEYKAELLLDMQAATEERPLGLITIAAGRDVPRGDKVSYDLVLSNPHNPLSFTFTLKEAENYDF